MEYYHFVVDPRDISGQAPVSCKNSILNYVFKIYCHFLYKSLFFSLKLVIFVLFVPFQCMESGTFSEASDVYSFGMVIWEMFSRTDPFAPLSPVKAAMRVLTRMITPYTPLEWLYGK